MAPKRKTSAKSKAKQPTITTHALPLPKKPMELVGKQIGVPGAWWEGTMSAEEKKTLYKCTVRDFKPRQGRRARGRGGVRRRGQLTRCAPRLSDARGRERPGEGRGGQGSAERGPHGEAELRVHRAGTSVFTE